LSGPAVSTVSLTFSVPGEVARDSSHLEGRDADAGRECWREQFPLHRALEDRGAAKKPSEATRWRTGMATRSPTSRTRLYAASDRASSVRGNQDT
jgi:hypothetical protein